MNAYDPLPPELLDELLSADLDGELAPAAADHGLHEHEARARIEATAGADARRAALASARRAIATEGIAVLDDVTRRRLLQQVRAAPAPERTGDTRPIPLAPRRRLRTALGAAAAVLVVAGLGTVIVTAGGGDDDDTATADTAAGLMEAERGIAGPLAPLPGDLSDPGVLRGALEGAAAVEAEPPSALGSEPAADSTDEITDGGAPTATASAEQAAACAETFTRDYGGAVDQLRGGVHGDTPAVVVLATIGDARVAVVYDAATCRQLEFQSVPAG
jgi:hypothetical protein